MLAYLIRSTLKIIMLKVSNKCRPSVSLWTESKTFLDMFNGSSFGLTGCRKVSAQKKSSSTVQCKLASQWQELREQWRGEKCENVC